MIYEWDEEKNRKNIEKHGISFLEATDIFSSPFIKELDERFDYGEERYRNIGFCRGKMVVMVITTDRNNKIRIISARRADKAERRKYYEKFQKHD